MGHTGKVVIVTGAGRGIGRCVAASYAAEGARVVIAERDRSTGEVAESSIREMGGEASFIMTDISVPDQVAAMVRATVEKYGTIDIVINNAGFGIWKSPLDLTIEEWDSVVNTNLRGAFLCAREAARACVSATTPPLEAAYASDPASDMKARVEAMLTTDPPPCSFMKRAASLAHSSIRVNCISPGWIETGDYSALRETDHNQHFSGRVGRPEDIARACLFLTGDGNEFINGENIIIDGGMTRKMIYEL